MSDLVHASGRSTTRCSRVGASATLVGGFACAFLWFVGPAAAQELPEPQDVRVRIDSNVADVSTASFSDFALSTLSDGRSWTSAGFRFSADPAAPYRVVLAEPAEVDRLCRPLQTRSAVSCQNGPVVALNAARWRSGPGPWWTASLDDYRRYMVNHEVGHLIGQRHPTPRCPDAGAPAAVMEQQTKGLEGCVANPWPLWWELERASARPAVIAPPPQWGPEPVPANLGAAAPTTVTTAPPAEPDRRGVAPAAGATTGSVPAPADPGPAVGVDEPAVRGEPGGAGDASAATDTSGTLGSTGIWPTWASLVLGLLLGACVAFGILRLRRGPRQTPVFSEHTWDVRVREGDHRVGRRADTMWIAPRRWDDPTTASFVEATASALRTGGDASGAGLAAAPPLRDGEGAAVLVRRGRGPVLAVFGTGELVVEADGRRSRRREAAVDLGDRDVDRFGVWVPGDAAGPTSVLLTRHRARGGATDDDAAAGDGVIEAERVG